MRDNLDARSVDRLQFNAVGFGELAERTDHLEFLFNDAVERTVLGPGRLQAADISTRSPRPPPFGGRIPGSRRYPRLPRPAQGRRGSPRSRSPAAESARLLSRKYGSPAVAAHVARPSRQIGAAAPKAVRLGARPMTRDAGPKQRKLVRIKRSMNMKLAVNPPSEG